METGDAQSERVEAQIACSRSGARTSRRRPGGRRGTWEASREIGRGKVQGVKFEFFEDKKMKL